MDDGQSSLVTSSSAITTPFVGREGEMAALDSAFTRALTGNGQIVLLVGEPGIGKTRTTEQLAAVARERGTLVLWGSCYEWNGAPAYWPWTQALRNWLHHADATAVEMISELDRTLLARIIPEIRAVEPNETSSISSTDPDADLFRLLTAVGSLIRREAQRQPLMVVLDDVHWADTPSLQLLRFLAQEIRDARVLVIATCRSLDQGREHPMTTILADLVREPNCHRLSLHGWPKPQVAQFVTLVTGRAQPHALIDTLYDRTNGNPFFIGEVARWLVAEGQFDAMGVSDAQRNQVPDGVRDAIRRRLHQLSASCSSTLAAAAIIGREFDVRLLERIRGTPTVHLLTDLDEAMDAHLLLPGTTPGMFRFSHALVQEVLYHEQPSMDRVRQHLAIADALEAPASGRSVSWALLAHHVTMAAPLSDPAKVCDYATAAGDAAMAQFNWETAASHYRQALAALDVADPTNDGRRCELLVALGDTLNRSGAGSGDVPAAREQFAQAFALAHALGDAEQMARAAVGFAGVNIVAAFGGPQQLHYLETALAALGPDDGPLRVRVLSRLALDLWRSSTTDRSRPQAVAAEAVEIARRLNDPLLIALSLFALNFASLSPMYLEERATVAAELIGWAEKTSDPLITAWGYMAQMVVDFERGSLESAEQMIAAMREYGERAHIPYVMLRAAAYQAKLDIATGRYADAEHHHEQTTALWQSEAPSQFQCQQFLLYRDRGRLDEFPSDIQLPNHLHLWRFAAQAHRMALALERNQQDQARADFETLMTAEFMRVPFDMEWYGIIARLTEAAAFLGDRQRAALLSDWLRPYAGRIMVGSSLGMCHGPVTLYLGQLATVQENWTVASTYFHDALAMGERLGLRPFTARALLGLAEISVKRNAAGDRDDGLRFVERSIAIAEAIGMHGLFPRARYLDDVLARSSTTIPSRTVLTARELDVLRLVAEGLSDADVAARLFVSPRTVGTHLTSIYTKLEVSSRMAAVRKATDLGLV
jgi:DNA-binding CsgD family transcriptional regulator